MDYREASRCKKEYDEHKIKNVDGPVYLVGLASVIRAYQQILNEIDNKETLT